MGDNCLVLAHRNSEWCGHGPALEEDIAVANISLDLIGQTQLWLALAGEEVNPRETDEYGEVRWDCTVTNQDAAVVVQYDVLTMVAKNRH